MYMTSNLLTSSLFAFHYNGLNSLIYSFTNNWCLILLVAAAVISVILGVVQESSTTIREEQTIL